MELNDFLKCKKVRCVDGDATIITTGKVYDVIGLDKTFIHVTDDNGEEAYYWYSRFEPVLDAAENPLQNIELTPEFGSVEPKFKVGDKVYYRSDEEIFVISDVSDFGDVQIKDWREDYHNSKYFCHATQENHAMLCKLYPHIEFEQPPKELMGSDLCFEKLRNGKKLVMCAVSDLSDEKAIKRLEDDNGCIRIIKDCDPAPYHFIDTHGIRHGFAVPLNDETGEPLTQAVLDE